LRQDHNRVPGLQRTIFRTDDERRKGYHLAPVRAGFEREVWIMSAKDCFKTIFMLFCIITTGVVLIMASEVALLERDAVFDYADLFKILLISSLSALPYGIFISKKELSGRSLLVRSILHLLSVIVIVFGLLWRFGWLTAGNAALIAVMFLGLYAVAAVISSRRDAKLANSINAKIREKRNSPR
jgi:hypothetical protein